LKKFYKLIWPVTTGYGLIRIGGKADGSYLIPDLLSGIKLCVSPGTCGFIEFERQLGQVYGIPSLLCDPEEDAPPNLPACMRFDRSALSARSGPGLLTFSEWLTRYGYENACPIILSMDIEGAEVEVLSSLTEAQLRTIRIATIEFHYLHAFHDPSLAEYAASVYSVVERLCRYFDVVNMKPNNNCPYTYTEGDSRYTMYSRIEVTFLNKMMRLHEPVHISPAALPHRLDPANVLHKPSADYSRLKDLGFPSYTH